jgi:hypothetical protein
MVDSSVRVGKAIMWGIIIFIGSAIIEGLINLWLFKKYGGCPMYKENKAK